MSNVSCIAKNAGNIVYLITLLKLHLITEGSHKMMSKKSKMKSSRGWRARNATMVLRFTKTNAAGALVIALTTP